jgi:hypothetical protein
LGFLFWALAEDILSFASGGMRGTTWFSRSETENVAVVLPEKIAI